MTAQMQNPVAVGTWTVLPAESRAGFVVGNLVVRRVSGVVPIRSAWVTVGPDAAITVQAELDLSAIDTGNARRDKDLRKPSLLDLDAHPALQYAAERVEPTADGWSVPGRITVKGCTVDLPLDATVTHDGPDNARVHATGRLDRRALGIKAPRFMVGTDVDIELDLRLSRR